MAFLCCQRSSPRQAFWAHYGWFTVRTPNFSLAQSTWEQCSTQAIQAEPALKGHQLWVNRGWSQHPLLAAAKASGAPMPSVSASEVAMPGKTYNVYPEASSHGLSGVLKSQGKLKRGWITQISSPGFSSVAFCCILLACLCLTAKFRVLTFGAVAIFQPCPTCLASTVSRQCPSMSHASFLLRSIPPLTGFWVPLTIYPCRCSLGNEGVKLGIPLKETIPKTWFHSGSFHFSFPAYRAK